MNPLQPRTLIISLLFALLASACGDDTERPTSDGGIPDAGFLRPDATANPDAATGLDATANPDAATGLDAAAETDAGSPDAELDAGSPPDLGAVDAGPRPTAPVTLRFVSISDWHAQLDPLSAPTGTVAVGGAAVLSAYFAQERQENPNTLVVTGGDAFGGSPPLAGFFNEEPAVLAMNLMGIQFDTFGNHNFDRGVSHLQEMIDLAEFTYVSSNLGNLSANLQGVASPAQMVAVGGLVVGIVGITNDDAASLVFPGRLGTLTIQNSASAAMAAQAAARAAGADVVIALVHMGATTREAPPTGPLIDFANAVSGFDVIFGDHTDIEVNAEVNGQLVVENLSKGRSYARVELTFDPGSNTVTARGGSIVYPYVNRVTPDPAVISMLTPYRTSLAQQLDQVIGVATDLFPRGNNIERLGEVAIGNLVTDALRTQYNTQIAVLNGGGIRAPIPSSYVPADTQLRRTTSGFQAGPPYDVVVGDAFTVFPFGNNAITRTVTGQQVWQMMEHGLSALPGANGRFAQISGFTVTYDPDASPGARVRSITLSGGAAIPNDAAVTFTMATFDFINSGGDGYVMLADGQGTVRDLDATALRNYIQAQGTLTPAITGRITAVTSSCGPARAPQLGDLLVNELLADPGAVNDANNDGLFDSTDDEFIEIANISNAALLLQGVTITDPGSGLRHTFGPRTLECGQVVVVFGGGDPQHANWQASWVVASNGSLAMNNTGDEIRLGLASGAPDALGVTSYGSAANNDESLVRQPELDPTAAFVRHLSAPGAGTRRMSPGTRVDGTAF